jgi:hypothetical protein
MAGTWTDLNNQPGASVDTMLLATDGTVLAHEFDSPNWHRLTPNASGDYSNGTWTTIPPMPPNSAIPAGQNGPTYAPRFFGSAILDDGTLLVVGGEYNSGVNVDALAATRFDPATSVWTNLPTPSGWGNLGDTPLCVLSDGTVLIGNINSSQTAIFDPVTLTFSAGPNKGDRCAEESFTLLPDGTVLAVDCTAIPNAEKYIPSSNSWVTAGTTPSTLPQACPGIVPEIGPTVLLPNGHAYVIGATGNTALYVPPASPSAVGTWLPGPQLIDTSSNTSFPIDAPAVLLPNGRVLLTGSPAPQCNFPGPTTFFEYDPATNLVTEVSAPSNSGRPCFMGRFLLLPSGNVLFSDQGSTVTLYTPGGSPHPSWKPVITSVPAFMAVGFDYLLSGEQFNGLSQACSYGDDATMATNYPIARLEGGGNVFYCRTGHHSTMAVATGTQTVSTILSIPASVPPGSYQLIVVANGIPSDPVAVTVASALPALSVDIENGGDLGIVCGESSIFLKIFNTGDQDLIVDQVFAIPSPGVFSVDPLPATPLTLAPTDEIEFTITFSPTTPDTTETAFVRIVSNDPNNPVFDVEVTATTGSGELATIIADSGDFGRVCGGSFRDQPLTLANTGTCTLTILDITSTSGAFLPPSVQSYPLTIEPGTAMEVPIRFRPFTSGPAAADITVFSDDPAGPTVVPVSGLAPSPRLTALIADTGNFGKVCVGSFADQSLVLDNSGDCPLFIQAMVSSSVDFLVPEVLSYPIKIGSGDSLPVPIRFQPDSFGPKIGAITVVSTDPSGMLIIPVRGDAPSGRIVITGSTCFGGVEACGCLEKTISICNVGHCPLEVLSAKLKRKGRHWKLVRNPFPATLHPGSCLSLVIRYYATEKCPRSQELIIISNDPVHPVEVLDLTAYTIWECGCKCGDECGKGGCDKCRGHREGAHPCCCHDDDDHDEDEDHDGE